MTFENDLSEFAKNISIKKERNHHRRDNKNSANFTISKDTGLGCGKP